MTTVTLELGTALDAAQALIRASRYDEAGRLVDALAPLPDHRCDLVQVELELARAYATGGVPSDDAVRFADGVARDAGSADLRWDGRHAALRVRYAAEIRSPGTALGSPEGRDAETVAELLGLAETLVDDAPSPGRRGYAEFLLGTVHANLLGQFETARAHYDAALRAALETGEEHLAFEALRHLGDHSHHHGDHALAREQWQASADHAARAGLVRGVLAQLYLLALLDGDVGRPEAGEALATTVAHWAAAVGATALADQARALATDF